MRQEPGLLVYLDEALELDLAELSETLEAAAEMIKKQAQRVNTAHRLALQSGEGRQGSKHADRQAGATATAPRS